MKLLVRFIYLFSLISLVGRTTFADEEACFLKDIIINIEAEKLAKASANPLLELLKEKDPTLYPVVSSINVNHKKFQNKGQIYTHIGKEGELLGVVLVTPENDQNIVYVSLDQINDEESIELIHFSKFSVERALLKVSLKDNAGLTPNKGGEVIVEVLDNGIKNTYRKFDFNIAKTIDGNFSFLSNSGDELSSIDIKTGMFGTKDVSLEYE